MASDCESVSIKYKGDGVQVLFTFPFTYMSTDDIVVFLYDDTTERWVDQVNRFLFANATTIEFLAAPPAPQDPNFFNVWITRKTDLTAMLKSFYAGSAIRAQDLNDNFDQLRLAIEEGRCSIEQAINDVYDPTDAWTKGQQEQGYWRDYDGDQKIATADAIAARHDAVIGEFKPDSIPYQQPGKTWQNTGESWTSYWSPEANAWVAYVNTGPRGEQGPRGNKGEKGDPGQGLKIDGYIGVPGPPTNPGTEEGELIIDSEGEGWIWDNDLNQWIFVGSIEGPQGEPGTNGTNGEDGAAATIAVGTTTTGDPGTEASVTNSGDSNAAVFDFVIPKGEKGDTGAPGAGNIDTVQGVLPIVVDSTTDSRNPVVSFDIYNLTSLPVIP